MNKVSVVSNYERYAQVGKKCKRVEKRKKKDMRGEKKGRLKRGNGGETGQYDPTGRDKKEER